MGNFREKLFGFIKLFGIFSGFFFGFFVFGPISSKSAIIPKEPPFSFVSNAERKKIKQNYVFSVCKRTDNTSTSSCEKLKKVFKKVFKSKKFLIGTCCCSGYLLLKTPRIPRTFFEQINNYQNDLIKNGDIAEEAPKFVDTLKDFVELKKPERRKKIKFIKNNQFMVFWLIKNNENLNLHSPQNWQQIFWERPDRDTWVSNFNRNVRDRFKIDFL